MQKQNIILLTFIIIGKQINSIHLEALWLIGQHFICYCQYFCKIGTMHKSCLYGLTQLSLVCGLEALCYYFCKQNKFYSRVPDRCINWVGIRSLFYLWVIEFHKQYNLPCNFARIIKLQIPPGMASKLREFLRKQFKKTKFFYKRETLLLKQKFWKYYLWNTVIEDFVQGQNNTARQCIT